MKSPTQAVAVLIAVGFIWGVLHLFSLTFAGGEVYPELSTLRSDPLGAKLLYESLARLPGVKVSRNYRPLESFEGSGATVLLLDLAPAQGAASAKTLQAIAAAGNRVVLALNGQPDVAPYPLYDAWGVRLALHTGRGRIIGVSFAEAKDWTERERIGSNVLAIEKAFGTGSVVLLAQSSDFANHATLTSERLDLVSTVLGNSGRFIFDEHHLGIAESTSVVALARQFGLSGFAYGLAICAALWIWRASSAFPPPRPAPATSSIAGRTSHSGLVTLLRRNIPPNELAGICWQQWLAVNRGAAPDRLERAASVARNQGADPIAAAREIQHAIQSKGNS